MDGKRTLYYAAIAIAVLIALSVVGTIISLAIGVTVWMVTWAIRLAVLAGLVYVAYKAGSWLLGDDNPPSIARTFSGLHVGVGWRHLRESARPAPPAVRRGTDQRSGVRASNRERVGDRGVRRHRSGTRTGTVGSRR